MTDVWTDDDDAAVAAETATTSAQLAVLRFRFQELGRVMRVGFLRGFRQGRERARERRRG